MENLPGHEVMLDKAGGYTVGEFRIPPSAPPRILDHFKRLWRQSDPARFWHRTEFDALKMYAPAHLQEMYLAPMGGEAIRKMVQKPDRLLPQASIRQFGNLLVDYGFSTAVGLYQRAQVFPVWLFERILRHNADMRMWGPKAIGPGLRQHGRGIGYTVYLATNDVRRRKMDANVLQPDVLQVYPDLEAQVEEAVASLQATTMMDARFVPAARASLRYAILMEQAATDRLAPSRLRAEYLRINDMMRRLARALETAPLEQWGIALSAPRAGVAMDLMLLSKHQEHVDLHPWYMLTPAELDPQDMPLMVSRVDQPAYWREPPMVLVNEVGDRRVSWPINLPTTGLRQEPAHALIMDALTSPGRLSRPKGAPWVFDLMPDFMGKYPELDEHEVRVQLYDGSDHTAKDWERLDRTLTVNLPVLPDQMKGYANYWKNVPSPIVHNELCQHFFKNAYLGLAQMIVDIDKRGGYEPDIFAAMGYTVMADPTRRVPTGEPT